jgi:hypothetical protein
MSSLRDLKPGDRVTERHYIDICGFLTVSEVLKVKLRTKGGRTWKMSGREWGNSDRYGAYIFPFKPEDEEKLVQQNEERAQRALAYALRDFEWTSLPIATLRAVKALLPEGEVKA